MSEECNKNKAVKEKEEKQKAKRRLWLIFGDEFLIRMRVTTVGLTTFGD